MSMRNTFDVKAKNAVLSVRDLRVSFAGESGPVHAVRGLNFDLSAGESMAIVGESGAGKSATSLAIMGLLPTTSSVNGSIKLHGEELLGQSDDSMSQLRGKSMAMVFQDPLSALTPVYTVGEQVVESIRVHNDMPKAKAMQRAVELLELVGIPEPQRRAHSFPHEYSGGMRQRAMIAMAIANDPDVIIADEPTTALDVTIQAQVLEVLKRARKETGAALILITHDLGVVAGIADTVTVMYAGRAVEQGNVGSIFHHSRMPYTIGLLGSVPRADSQQKQPLAAIEGNPPSMLTEPRGCAFAPRCPLVVDACLSDEPSLTATDVDGHHSACIRSADIATEKLTHRNIFPVGRVHDSTFNNSHRSQCSTVLKLSNVKQHYPLFEGAVFRRRVGTVHAVDGVDFDIKKGETLGLVGESGCGKSTTIHAILDLKPPTSGEISVFGTNVAEIRKRTDRRELRRKIQVVFQDPLASLDPRMPVFDIIAEPLGVFRISSKDIEHRVHELLALVGLESSHLNRYPQQLSGGQRQRIGIARALAMQPNLLILDEPVSALDVSIRAGVINLLEELKSTLALSYLFVAHDLALIRHIADRVAVMYLGSIVEIGNVNTVYEQPAHPYTRSLLSAMPIPDPNKERGRQRILLEGDLPSAANPPTGCRFRTRCPKKIMLKESQQQRCINESPPLQDISIRRDKTGERSGNTEHASACHFNDLMWA